MYSRKWGGGICAETGYPLKLPSPTILARLGHFPPASQAGRLAGPVFYVYVISLVIEAFNCDTDLKLVEPGRLVVMLCGEDAGVQEHEADDEPEHPLGLAHQPRLSAHAPVPPVQRRV